MLWIGACLGPCPRSARAEVVWFKDSLKEVYRATGQFYSYAPVMLEDGEVERLWCCRNLVPGVIRDHIFYLERRGGKLAQCEPVLRPAAAGAWDGFHVCDPSVIGGDFRLNGTRYRYALFYLGNNVDASANNQIGVAFANGLGGQWTRRSTPLIAYPTTGQWGVGQPSAVSLDGKGRVLLFYTKGANGTAGYVCEVEIGDAEGPVVGKEIKLPSAGLLDRNGQPDYLNNFDVVYDSGHDRFLAIREQHPYPSTEPRVISTSLQLVSIPAPDLRRGQGHWTIEGSIGPELTGLARNHNAGFARTLSGTLPQPDEVRVVFSSSCAQPDCAGSQPLWTYALWEIRGRLSQAK